MKLEADTIARTIPARDTNVVTVDAATEIVNEYRDVEHRKCVLMPLRNCITPHRIPGIF